MRDPLKAVNSKPCSMKSSVIDQVYDHLLCSEIFTVYRMAYEQVTKHTLALIHPTVARTPDVEISRCNNDYCSVLLEGNVCSKRCREHTEQMAERAQVHSHSKECDGKITTSLIPVKCQNNVVGFLRTGQVKIEKSQLTQEVIDKLAANMPESVAADLLDKFSNLPEFDSKTYVNQLVILGAFAMQLTEFAERLVTGDKSTSLLAQKCKNYIKKQLTEKICLDELAAHVKVTNSYMCKQFKKATGLTIVEYITVERVNMAKKELGMNESKKITEIAFGSGFQSLSQFNKSFARNAGMTPSAYRESLR